MMVTVRRWKFVLIVLAATAPVLVGCTAPTGHESRVAELVAQADAAPTPRLDWAPCAEAGLAESECATATVPLDYSRTDGPTIELAVVRQRATDQQRRIGTLFSAVGGPGGSGVDAARDSRLFEGEIGERFDVVTFDQRGVGRSSQVRCFADDAAQERFWLSAMIPPANAEQESAAERNSRALAQGCAEHSGELLPYLTTVDAARDMDLLRRAVGAEQMTYAGGSYASYLGEVYGALFPDRVRALQLTSMIDPETYTDDTRAMLTTIAAGTEEVRSEFFRRCAEAGAQRCSFADPGRSELTGPSPERGDKAGSAAPTSPEWTTTTAPPVDNTAAEGLRARDEALLARLREGPITVGEGENAVPVSYVDAAQAHAMLLYDPEQGWPALATLLTELESGPRGDAAAVEQVLGAGMLTFDFLESFLAISCADNSFPFAPGDWPGIVDEIDSSARFYGSFWFYGRQACAAWPDPEGGYPQRWTGPWTLSSDKPALLLQNRYDPATPVELARAAQQEMVNARLVVVNDGYGHSPAGACVRHLRERYLVDLRLPAPGATCNAESEPFDS